jgi:hypothetical protein
MLDLSKAFVRKEEVSEEVSDAKEDAHKRRDDYKLPAPTSY